MRCDAFRAGCGWPFHWLAGMEIGRLTLSRTLMAAEAQLEAILATGLPLDASDLARLRDFLRHCRFEAAELEAIAPSSLIPGHGGVGIR
jgi:hypothetical protein